MSSAAKPDSAGQGDFLEFPASVAQEAFFYLEQIESGVTPFNIAVRFFLRGKVDRAILRASLNAVAARHEVLRTCFEERDGDLFQVVAPDVEVPLADHDLSGLGEKERSERLQALGLSEARHRFDLRRLPLIRAALADLGGDEAILHLTVHHAVADGWSIGLITGELAARYRAIAAGESTCPPELPLQYADFSVWQREYLKGPEIASQREYWRGKLGDMVETELPTDLPRPASKRWNGDIVSIELPSALTERLGGLARANGATLFHVFLAACKVLLKQNSGSDDIAVGTPVAGRDRPELEPLIGTFINSVILRTNLSGNPSFSELIKRVRDTALGAMENHELPFEMLVRELRPERHAGRNPLFQINYTHQRDFVRPESFHGITLTAIPSVSPGAIFDVHFFTVERDGVWRLSCDYCTDIFERSTAVRWLDQFRALLDSVAANPELPIESLGLAGPQEQARLLGWGIRKSDYPSESTIGGLLVEIARACPEKTALVQEEVRISYSELLSRAIGLARLLGPLDPGTRVGIFTTGSTDVIIGLAGILLAGGAYVPIDPTLPAERIRFLVEDAGLSVLVSDGGGPSAMPGIRVVAVPGSGIPGEPPPGVRVSAGDPAYVLYTSGSTGSPKGVIVPHRGVVRLVRGADYMDFRSDEVFLQAAPLSFDASTFEIWGALLNGATLVVPRPGSLALDRIAGSIREHGVTTLWLTAGLFQTMVDEHLEDLAGLRNLLAGGDVLSIPHVRRAMASLPGTRFVNGYGPTENTTFTACHAMSAADLERTSIPIGRPVMNTSVVILDDAGRMVPEGVPGELYTGGDGLAIGYLNDPGRTAMMFVESPVPGLGRLYRTGDRARWRGDGTIEFLGRRDRQVKIRGVRVEPGEVEAAVASHPDVAECRVGIRGRSSSEKVLVAWVRAARPIDRSLLGDYLKARLPAFLCPDAIVFVDRFPLTVSGKFDMAALPDPDISSRTKSAPPETPTEKQLAGIWRDLLGMDAIGRDDSFFHLGGHSLLALRMFSRLHREFGLTLPLATLLRAPTLRMLASLMDRELEEESPDDSGQPVLAVIHPEGSATPLFCIHAGDGGVLVYREMLPHMAVDRPVLAIESPGLLAGRGFRVKPIEETARWYLETVRRRQPAGPYLLAGYSYGGMVAYEMAIQLAAAGEEVAFLALIDTAAPDARLVKAGFFERLRRHLERRHACGFSSRAALTVGYLASGLRRRLFPAPEQPGEAHSDDQQYELREAHAATMRAYRPGAYSGTLTLFRAMDPGGSVFDFLPDMGWLHRVGELRVIEVPGSHITLFDSDNIRVLARQLQARISACGQ